MPATSNRTFSVQYRTMGIHHAHGTREFWHLPRNPGTFREPFGNVIACRRKTGFDTRLRQGLALIPTHSHEYIYIYIHKQFARIHGSPRRDFNQLENKISPCLIRDIGTRQQQAIFGKDPGSLGLMMPGVHDNVLSCSKASPHKIVRGGQQTMHSRPCARIEYEAADFEALSLTFGCPNPTSFAMFPFMPTWHKANKNACSGRQYQRRIRTESARNGRRARCKHGGLRFPIHVATARAINLIIGTCSRPIKERRIASRRAKDFGDSTSRS